MSIKYSEVDKALIDKVKKTYKVLYIKNCNDDNIIDINVFIKDENNNKPIFEKKEIHEYIEKYGNNGIIENEYLSLDEETINWLANCNENCRLYRYYIDSALYPQIEKIKKMGYYEIVDEENGYKNYLHFITTKTPTKGLTLYSLVKSYTSVQEMQTSTESPIEKRNKWYNKEKENSVVIDHSSFISRNLIKYITFDGMLGDIFRVWQQNLKSDYRNSCFNNTLKNLGQLDNETNTTLKAKKFDKNQNFTLSQYEDKFVVTLFFNELLKGQPEGNWQYVTIEHKKKQIDTISIYIPIDNDKEISEQKKQIFEDMKDIVNNSQELKNINIPELEKYIQDKEGLYRIYTNGTNMNIFEYDKIKSHYYRKEELTPEQPNVYSFSNVI